MPDQFDLILAKQQKSAQEVVATIQQYIYKKRSK